MLAGREPRPGGLATWTGLSSAYRQPGWSHPSLLASTAATWQVWNSRGHLGWTGVPANKPLNLTGGVAT